MMQFPIEQILMDEYNKLKRDEEDTPVYEGQLKQVAVNLLKHHGMNSRGFQTCYEFSNDLLKRTFPANVTLYSLPEKSDCKAPYVGSVLIDDIWKKWRPSDSIFISAGTGKGKNTFIKEELLHDGRSGNIVIFENRESLMQQQVIDLVSELDPDAVNYTHNFDEGMVIFGGGRCMLISYQKAALKCASHDSDFLRFCSNAKYLVFDEVHFILDDANFNKGISFFVNCFFPDYMQEKLLENQMQELQAKYQQFQQMQFQWNVSQQLQQVTAQIQNIGRCLQEVRQRIQRFSQTSTRIFMSGSMEEFYAYIQSRQPFHTIPSDIIKEKREIENGEENIGFKIVRNLQPDFANLHVLSLPTNYCYIKPHKYRDLGDICSQITKTPEGDKWLIFVTSIQQGEKLKAQIENECNDSVCFLDAENKNSKENKETYQSLINNSSFDCRVLIATTVIYNGINIKDKKVKHIVIPFTTPSVVKQLIGRRRVDHQVQETINVYFPIVSYQDIMKHYIDLIGKHIEVIGLRKDRLFKACIQANHLSKSGDSEFYYLDLQRRYMPDGQAENVLIPVMNEPAIFKLFSDTCFYIFCLQRMEPAADGQMTDFVAILLQHLGSLDKVAEVVDITIQATEEKKETTQKKLIDYLENLVDKVVVSPDENDSYDSFLELKRVINTAYKELHGVNIDPQWKNKDRFFKREILDALLKDLHVPYAVVSNVTKGERKTCVSRKETL